MFKNILRMCSSSNLHHWNVNKEYEDFKKLNNLKIMYYVFP